MAMVLFVVGMTAFTSCTKSKEKLILGNWKLEKVSATYAGQTFQMSVAELVKMLSGYGVDEDIEDIILEFKNDGYVYFQGEGAQYTIDGDKLTLLDEEESLEATITELTRTEMTLEGTEVYVDEETGITMEMTFDLYFKKV